MNGDSCKVSSWAFVDILDVFGSLEICKWRRMYSHLSQQLDITIVSRVVSGGAFFQFVFMVENVFSIGF